MNALKALGVLALATSVVLLTSGTGSFTAAHTDRRAALSVTDDDSALVDYEVSCEERTVRHGPIGGGPDDHLVDADLGGNESAGSDDDGIDADILSKESADSDDDLVDANVFSNASAESDDDLVGIDIGSEGVTVDSSPRVSTRAELTVTVINRFARPLEGSVTVDGTTVDIGPIPPGGTGDATFEGAFDAGDPIAIDVTRPIPATLDRSVPRDCEDFTDDPRKGIGFLALCGVSLDADLNVSVVDRDGGEPTAVRWESNGPVALVVTKAGSDNGGSAEPGIQRHPVDGGSGGVVSAIGEEPTTDLTPASPCPEGLVGVKFDTDGSGLDGETVGD